ncbi:MAG: divergent polysaccharide deacetylase family protein [Candidatus Muirbacterium halophilum]|nr:divergent polysaccharide deacetylase family protein [Candidatus Muirbacterium halophilum]MCK9474916.1 divergent polysaccharide deacetylase family protein [Candidatus Muirbacterium halophilum]
MNKKLFIITAVFISISTLFWCISLFTQKTVVIEEVPAQEYENVVIPEPIKNNIYDDKEEINKSEHDKQYNGYMAIVMDDLGYGYENKFELFKRLKEKNLKITMSIIPGLYNTKKAHDEAYENGFEIMAHIPMETKNIVAQETNVIKINQKRDDIIIKLNNMLKELKHVKGANNHQGSLATSDKSTMLTVLTFLKRNNLYFVDSLTTSDSVVKNISGVLNTQYMARDIFMDNKNEHEYIKEQLDKAVAISLKRGVSISICHVRKNTIDVLENYLPELIKEKNIKLLFVSEILKDKKKFSLTRGF